MAYYNIILSGANIYFENYHSDQPVIGFIACRLVRAQTQELALALAKRDLLVDWNHSFNADRKLGLPSLRLEHIAPFKGLLKPKNRHDYYWFTDDAHKQQHLESLTTPAKKWFWCKILQGKV